MSKKSSVKKSSVKKSLHTHKAAIFEFSSLYTFKTNIHYHIINYKDISDKFILNKVDNHKNYSYNELKTIENTYKKQSIGEQKLYESIKSDEYKRTLKQVSEGYARGVAKYIIINYKLSNKTSNAYMKLWEIYMSIPQLIQNKNKQLNVFHMAEAPGQWINCTKHFIDTKRYKIKKYNWLANSLNHKNPENIKKYGKGIFADDYGFIKKNPKKWLYGKDDTGDITNSDNIRWF